MNKVNDALELSPVVNGEQPVTELNAGESGSVANTMRLHMQDEMDYSTSYKALYDKQAERENSIQEFHEYTPLEVVTAGFIEHNPISSWMVRKPLSDVEDIPGYSPFTKDESGKTDIDGYEQYWDVFSESFNPATTAELKSRIDREKQNQKVLDSGGGWGIAATVAAELGNPVNLFAMMLPGYGQANMLKIAGESIAVGTAAATVSELALHGTQETRTIEESALNIASTAILDGILGASVGALKQGQYEVLQNEIKTHMRSAGAQEIASPGGASGAEVIKNGPLARFALFASKMTPIGRALQSKQKIVRALAQDMTESSFRLHGEYSPTSVESLINLDYSKYAVSEQNVNKLERAYVKNGGTAEDFSFELSSAMRNGDNHSNAYVQSAAKELRKHIDNTWNRAAQAEVEGTFQEIDGEIVPIKTTTAASYMTRRKDVNAIRNDPKGYQDAWVNGLRDRHDRYNAQLLEENPNASVKPFDEESAKKAAFDIYKRDINLTVGEMQFETSHPSVPTQTKQRVDVKDEFLDTFLVKDWRSLMDGYMRSMAPKARMAERFGNYKLTDQFDRLQQRLDSEVEAIDKKIKETPADAKKLNKEKNAVQKDFARDVSDLTTMRNRLLNEVNQPSLEDPVNKYAVSGLRTMRAWNVATMLSNVVISSVPDLARQMTYNGILPFAKAFKNNALTKSIRRSNLAKDDMARLAQSIEKTQSVRIKEMTDVDDSYVATPLDKKSSYVAGKTMTLVGMQHWNALGKGIVGNLFGDRVARALINGTDKIKLNQIGIDDTWIKELSREAKKHADKVDGLYNLNIDRWDVDIEIIERIEAAAIKEANTVVVTPGAGDKPVFMDGEMAKTIFQFKSFLVASTNRMMVPLFQESGVRPYAEIAASGILGMAVYALKEQIGDREVTSDPKQLAWEAANHTGLLGYTAELYRMQFAATGLDPAGVMEGDRKYYSRGSVGAFAGPSAATVANIWKVNPANTMVTPEQKAKAWRRLMPLQNHFILGKGYNHLEEEAAKVLPEKSE